MLCVYVLKLESNKFYVGKTNNDPEIRFSQHLSKERSTEWTRIYKPIEIIQIYEDCDDFDEDKYTLMYMKIHGIDNVRGGSFCEINLPQENVNTIKKMIRGSCDKCFICGSDEHFAKKCPTLNQRLKSPTLNPRLKSPERKKRKRESDEEQDQKGEDSKFDETNRELQKSFCNRCGRNSHCIGDCYATYHLNGRKLKKLKVS